MNLHYPIHTRYISRLISNEFYPGIGKEEERIGEKKRNVRGICSLLRRTYEDLNKQFH